MFRPLLLQLPTAAGDANWLRLRGVSGQQSYFRQNICLKSLNPVGSLSFMHMPAVEVGQRLQSWGAQANNQVATPEQLEAAKAKRIARALAASIAAPSQALGSQAP